LVGVSAFAKGKRETTQASNRHGEQHKSQPVKGKFDVRRQLATLSVEVKYIGAGKLKPDTGCHGCNDKRETNESERSSIHASATEQYK
jgi:hypothetical protein